MAANKKPKKKYVPKYASKLEMLYVMREASRTKSTVNSDDKEKLVETARATLERMKTTPDQNGLVDMADITNIICDLIHLTDTDKKRKKYFNSPDVHFHLWNKGWKAIAKTINSTHYALYDMEKRVREKGSFTIDSSVVLLFGKIVEMYKDALDIAPRGLLRAAIADTRGSHREEDGKFRISHFELADTYYINEEVWDEMLEPEEVLYAA